MHAVLAATLALSSSTQDASRCGAVPVRHGHTIVVVEEGGRACKGGVNCGRRTDDGTRGMIEIVCMYLAMVAVGLAGWGLCFDCSVVVCS